MTSRAMVHALAVTAELTGTMLSEAAARVLAKDLAPYPEDQVLGALTRCRKELKGRLTVHEITSRLEDGRPGPEEAWALVPRFESQTVVWTEEIAAAWGIAEPMLADGDRMARMAFLEHYRAAVARARDAGVPVKWMVSLGTDPRGRESAIEQAVRLGRLAPERAAELLPDAGGLHPSIGAQLRLTQGRSE